MPASAWYQFIFIMGLGFVVAGLTTYVITWMLVAVHLRDHHAAEHEKLRGFILAPHAFGWYLAARWRGLGDRVLAMIALPGSIGAWAILVGAIAATVARILSRGGSA